MMQGGRLLVIFSRGSPLRALRMASISWGDTEVTGTNPGHTEELALCPLPPHPSRTCTGSWQGGKRENSSRG